MQSFDELWEAVAKLMYENKYITDIGYNLWLGDSYIMDFSNNTFHISVPTSFHRDIVEKTYHEKLTECFGTLIGTLVNVEYVVNVNEARGIDFNKKEEEIKPIENDSFGDELTFESFVLGSSNKYAQAASMAVAENPAKFYNPLLIYGASGVGKTHLMFAIKNRIHKLYPDMKIEYITCETFMNIFMKSLNQGTMDLFHKRFRSVDVLLVDDIQFLNNKHQLQEEFFNTFEALKQANKQIVLTSDRAPKDINNLDDRLKGRFENGLLADISAPDLETRVGIITVKAQNMGIMLDNEFIFYIADQVKNNIRQIEGILNQIKAYISLHKTNPTISVIQGYIKNISSEMKVDPVTTDRVILEVARYFSIEENDIRSRKRNANLVWARHVSIYIISKVTGISNSQISKDLKMDHTSVSHALKNVEKQMSIDPYKKRSIEELIDNLNKLR